MFLFIILVSIFTACVLGQASITSAVKTAKDVVYQGSKHDYLVYEVMFDQDIYFVENCPCPVTNTCSSKVSKESNYEAEELISGIELESLVNEDFQLFKFYLKRSEHCSTVRVIISNHWGEVSGYVGVGRIPTTIDYDFFKPPGVRDSVWICSQEEAWAWGWWYVLVARSGLQNNNHFQISWDTIESPIYSPPPEEQEGVLVNDVAYRTVATYEEYKSFRFPLSNDCEDFSVSLRKSSHEKGNLDLFVSFSSERPTRRDHSFQSVGQGDKSITLAKYCNHEGFAYISVLLSEGDQVPFVLTATTTTSFVFRKVGDLPPQQFLYSLSQGHVTLECGLDVLKCETPFYETCLDYKEENCCGRLSFLPSQQDIMLWSTLPYAVERKEYYNLPWKITPSIIDNVSNKLVFLQYLQVESPYSGRVYSRDENCSAKFNNILTDFQGIPIPDVQEFLKAEHECKFDDTADTMVAMIKEHEDPDTLRWFDILLSGEMNTNALIGCSDLLDTFLVLNTTSTNYTVTECNTTYDISILREKPTAVAPDFSLGECPTGVIRYYVERMSSSMDCARKWEATVKEASVASNFVFECSEKLFGKFEGLGSYCETDEDCYYGVACDLNRGRCNHTTDHLKECWWENSSELALKSLFNYWETGIAPSKEVFLTEIDKYKKVLCEGPGSFKFRRHYSYELIDRTCQDECTLTNRTVGCYNAQCEASSICSECPRYLKYTEESNEENCENVQEFIGCYDCTLSMINNGSCVYYNFTREECLEGLCVQNISIHDKALCEETNHTSEPKNVLLLKDYLYPLEEGCFESFSIDYKGIYSCKHEKIDNPWGCLSNATREECIGRWLGLSYLEGEGCLKDGLYTQQTREACNCSRGEWQPLFPLTESVISKGIVKPLVWNPTRERRLEQNFDLIEVFQMATKAVSRIVALDNYEYSYCKSHKTFIYNSLVCTLENRTGCYIVGVPGGEKWTCPFSAITIVAWDYVLQVDDKFVPRNGTCKTVATRLLPFTAYQLPVRSRLSSQAFTELPPNPWSVLKENNLVVSGQMITNAVDISFDFEAQSNLTVCMYIIFGDADPPSDLFDTFSYGIIEGKEVRRYGEAWTNEQGQLCYLVDKPGIYIGLKVRNVSMDSLLAQSIIAAAIYLFLSLIVVFQVLNIYLEKEIRWLTKLLSTILIFLFLVIRGIYFIMYPTGIVDQSVSYVFFELPTFMFITMDTILIGLWLEVAHTAKILNPSPVFSRRVFVAWCISNLFILASFSGFVAAYYILAEGEQSDCSVIPLTQSNESLLTNKIYVVFVATICIVLSLLMLLSGVNLVKLMQSNMVDKSIPRLLLWTWFVMIIFPVTFAIKSVLMIASVFTGFTLPILVFTSLEQIPTAVLLYYLNPPVNYRIKKLREIMSGRASTSSKHTSTEKEYPSSL